MKHFPFLSTSIMSQVRISIQTVLKPPPKKEGPNFTSHRQPLKETLQIYPSPSWKTKTGKLSMWKCEKVYGCNWILLADKETSHFTSHLLPKRKLKPNRPRCPELRMCWRILWPSVWRVDSIAKRWPGAKVKKQDSNGLEAIFFKIKNNQPKIPNFQAW